MVVDHKPWHWTGRKHPKHQQCEDGDCGIVRDLSRHLAERGISIDDLHTEIVDNGASAQHLFKVRAVLVVPETLTTEVLRAALDKLATEMMVDIALGER